MFLKGEWINKPWCKHPMEYYSVTKRNEVSTHTATWMKLKFLRVKSQLENSVDFGVPFTRNSEGSNPTAPESKAVIPAVWEEEQ